MLNRVRGDAGSAMITALMAMLVILPLGLALLAIVDTQARDSGSERTRDRAFNLADGALSSAAFNLSKYNWPSSGAAAPSNTAATGTAAACSGASYGATLGAATNPGSATSKLQPGLNSTYDDAAYTGASWQINVCDDDPADLVSPRKPAWKDALLERWNYDQNANGYVWIRAEAHAGDRKRVLAALVRPAQVAALSSKFGLMTGRVGADVTNSAHTLLSNGLLGSVVSSLLDTHPLVAADPLVPAPASGVTAVRCGILDGCLMGVLAGASALPVFGTLVSGGSLVQATSPTAASAAAILQLKQQAMASGTYLASTLGATSATDPLMPQCVIPAAASDETIVYIDQVGTGDQYCWLNVGANPKYKALVIGHGRIVLRGNGHTNGGTFLGLVYALNQQRETLGDASLPAREVIRIEEGAHVIGGVAADGKSAEVGIHPPEADCGLCLLSSLLRSVTLDLLDDYNPAIMSSKAVMEKVTVAGTATVVAGTYKDVAGEQG
jgi:Tfp pilus assembly protein PilX